MPDVYGLIMDGQHDKGIRFADLRNLLLQKGFSERAKGSSHHIYYKTGIIEIINLQPDGAKAKPYQVKQVRILFNKYGL